jgi:hypothetical protein
MELKFVPLPSDAEALAQFRAAHHSGAQPTTPDDEQATGAHLIHGLLFDLTHCLVHARRLNEPEVQNDPAATAFNSSHCQHHAEEAATGALSLLTWLREYSSDAGAFSEAFDQLGEQLDDDEPPPAA